MSISFEKVTHVEVTSLWAKRDEIFKADVLDLKDNKIIDSAGIAFLVQWAKTTPQKRLTILNGSSNVQSLIKVFKVGPLFELKTA